MASNKKRHKRPEYDPQASAERKGKFRNVIIRIVALALAALMVLAFVVSSAFMS